MNLSYSAAFVLTTLVALTGTACVDEETQDSSAGIVDPIACEHYQSDLGGSVMGTISVNSDVKPLDDGEGTLCFGLYDPAHGCPATGAKAIRRLVGQFFMETDVNASDADFPFVLHNVPPGKYLFASRFDADDSGCQSDANSGDVVPSDCVEVSVETGEVVELALDLSFVIPGG